jgi:hypothetical protein
MKKIPVVRFQVSGWRQRAEWVEGRSEKAVIRYWFERKELCLF